MPIGFKSRIELPERGKLVKVRFLWFEDANGKRNNGNGKDSRLVMEEKDYTFPIEEIKFRGLKGSNQRFKKKEKRGGVFTQAQFCFGV